jgi:uncharacterized protein YjcR
MFSMLLMFIPHFIAAAQSHVAITSDGWIKLLSLILSVQTTLSVYFARRAAAKAAQVKETLIHESSRQQDSILDVKLTLAKETKNQNKKLDEIHKFVDGSYGLALRSAALALKRLAALTGNSLDAIAASEATTAADVHDQRQIEFDNELVVEKNKQGA